MHLNNYRPEGSVISLPENREYLLSEQGIQKAITEGVILEGMAIRCDSDYRLTVDLGGYKGYIFKEDVQYSPTDEETRDIAVITRVGKAVCFKIVGFFNDKGKRMLKLSRREAQREFYENRICDMIPGDILEAKITHLESFGAFVDIGCGIISLLSIDCISVSRISHPSDRFNVGDRIKVAIKSIDRDNGRICVTHKELLGTWKENAELFSVGQTVAGVVRSVEEYGIFVELTPNLAGLAEYREDISVGQTTAVYIKNIIPERMKLKLVIIDAYKGENEPKRHIEGFDDDTIHIDSWKYSPDECVRIIQTVF